MPLPCVIVVDGHDGSGKTTLATMLAHTIGGCYVHPFEGEVADRFGQYVEQQDFDRLDRLTRAAVDQVSQQRPQGSTLVFDRHWLTVFSVLPARYHAAWLPPPKTFLCWADWQATHRRVSARGETARNSPAYHRRYCQLFLELARQYDVPVVNTTSATPEEALARMTTALGR